ncbi:MULTISPECIES: PTS cellobiose transporter subunit IIA [Streptococcus]|jgi:PTS system, lactose/cellobiose specific IIA subunit|uniref:PTS cellobiose transporter subunit IIA n=1 Tax=Streptococcus sanguinis TaxID=1305 RepID=A0A3R9GKC0_STRSA|nr:PTS cellobiose transporter subunit IIA [Streptococcus sanguinis]RKW03193.1 MAG: PTS cellobiose transporter subunit IIA [Streptococcus sp.]MBF1703261.1 PTS cellobiose transporter subunit IIA [Streptococcus sanguinis]MBZ2020474.1 PTS cellobiose transporter subunit IIA [Streptococcus sanguinis]MBZ2039174.1 PTS cellobiose transporter subunit IIA [Streptococcus sanguinis]MBZ2068299.1 PTS cellobiose transporter subunit IIA [Streptococcus sanguinis]
MNQEELQVAAFEIILHSGTARTIVHEAFADMREGRYDAAAEKLETSNESLLEAHHAQTKLLQDYASGIEIRIEIIMVHAQDHLMTTMTLREVALEMLNLYRKVEETNS